MNTPTYQDKLNELRDIIDTIAMKAADVDLSSYHDFCQLVEASSNDVTNRIRRAEMLIKTAHEIIQTSEAPKREPVVANIDIYIAAPNSIIEAEMLGGEPPHNNFKGFTTLGRTLINTIGSLIEFNIDALLKDSEAGIHEIICLAKRCRDIGAALNGFNIISNLSQLHPNNVDIKLAIVDLCADPGIRFDSLNIIRLILYEIFKRIDTSTPKLNNKSYEDYSDKDILADFMKSFDSGEHYMPDDGRLLTLVNRHLPQAIAIAKSRSDFYRLAQMLPAKSLPTTECSLPLSHQLADAALAALGAPTALALALLTKDYARSLDLLESYDINTNELRPIFQEMAEMPVESTSHFLKPAISSLRNDCMRYGLITSITPCPLMELCQIQVCPEQVFHNPDSTIAQLLRDPSAIHYAETLNVEWWSFSRTILDGILDCWNRILFNGEAEPDLVEMLIGQLFRGPDIDVIFDQVIDGILQKRNQLPASLRIDFAITAVRRNNWEAFAALLGDFNMHDEKRLNEKRSRSNWSDNYGGDYWAVKCDPLWSKLFSAVRDWKQYSTIALQTLSRCLTEDSYSADNLTENAFFLRFLSFAKKGDHQAAYNVVKDCIAQCDEQNKSSISYLLYFLGCRAAYKIGLDMEAAELANTINLSIADSPASIQKDQLNLLIQSSGLDIAPLLFTKLSGATNEDAITTQKQAEELLRVIKSESEAELPSDIYGANDCATFASSIIEFYPAHYALIDSSSKHDPIKAIRYLKKCYAIDRAKLFETRLTMAVASMINAKAIANDSQVITKTQFNLIMMLNDYLHQQHEEILVKLQQEADEARVTERNQVIADLSHHIKNLVAKVLDPLQQLKSQVVDTLGITTIERALRGGALIREIVNAMNLSYRGNAEDFRQDATLEPAGAQSLESLFLDALVSALSNMFDEKYFERFSAAYFPDDVFHEAKSAFDQLTQQQCVLLQDLVSFTTRYMCDLDLDIAGMDELCLLDQNGSQIKMMIALNEMLLNAIKYTAEQERCKRFIRVCFSQSGDNCIIQVENSCKVRKLASKTGLGHVVLQNFAKIMDGVCDTFNQDGVYRLRFTFADFWKGVS